MTEAPPPRDFLVVEHDVRKVKVRPYTDGEIARIGTINDVAAIALAVLSAVIGAGLGLIMDVLPPTVAIGAVLFLVGAGAVWVLRITKVPAARWIQNGHQDPAGSTNETGGSRRRAKAAVDAILD